MTTGDAFNLGREHAALAGAWTLGLLSYVLPLMLAGALIVYTARAINLPHRIRVHRIRRATTRTGRT